MRGSLPGPRTRADRSHRPSTAKTSSRTPRQRARVEEQGRPTRAARWARGALAVAWLLWVALCPSTAVAQTDPENCLMCHRYPTIGVELEDGTARSYYVNPDRYLHSPHGRVKCSNCHLGFDRIPHEDGPKVDCATKCHLVEPSTEGPFSHVNMIEGYEASVHGRTKPSGQPMEHADDLPTCLDCHTNRVIGVPDDVFGRSAELTNETLARCQGCHTGEGWAEVAFAHVTHRMRRPRQMREVIYLCTRCHEDGQRMERHGIESIETFKETYHWKLVKYNDPNAPDCISCHVPMGYSAHTIRPSADTISPLSSYNRVRTCANIGGVQTCHPNATEKFARGRVHAYGDKVAAVDRAERHAELPGDAVLLETSAHRVAKKDLFHYRVLKFLTLFYKVLIGLVVGGMVIHQGLDYLRASKDPH